MEASIVHVVCTGDNFIHTSLLTSGFFWENPKYWDLCVETFATSTGSRGPSHPKGELWDRLLIVTLMAFTLPHAQPSAILALLETPA
jgi:hypothetical protein